MRIKKTKATSLSCAAFLGGTLFTPLHAWAAQAGAIAGSAMPVHIPAQSMGSALDALGQQTHTMVVYTPDAVKNLQAHAVNGVFTPHDALTQLLAGSNLESIEKPGGGLIIKKNKAGKAVKKSARKEPDDAETVFSVGHRYVKAEKRTSNIVMDSIAYDPYENLGGNSSIASSLVLLPGVTGIINGDEPRYVSLRGISPDLNHTTVDGLTMASIGETGSGTRRVNLQDTPVEMTSRTNVYKSFTAEQSGDAIGGIIDLIPMSAFDHKGFYAHLDGYGIYSTYKGSVGNNGIKGYSPHLGAGEKSNISYRFGKEKQFGIVISSRYQDRVTNQTGSSTGFQYLDKSGKALSTTTDPTTNPNWNGRMTPSSYSNSEYANMVTTLGGSGKLEWRPVGTNIKASILGWTYRRSENVMGDMNVYNLKNTVQNQTDNSGTIQVNSLYVRRIQSTYSRNSNGIMGHLDWKHGNHSVVVRAGYTWEGYDNYQPLERMRAYPKKLYATYSGNAKDGDIIRLTSLSSATALQNSTWSAYQMQQQWRSAEEGIPTVRADYTYNTDYKSRGFGLAAGFEWRELSLENNIRMQEYDTGFDMTNYANFTNYVPSKWNLPYVFLNADGRKFDWSSLTQGSSKLASSIYDSKISNFRYKEDVTDGYVSLHYALKNTVFIAGVRADDTSYSAWMPTVSNNLVSDNFTKKSGNYINPLPSFDFVHRFPWKMNIHGAYSRSIGRPTPSNIAQAENITCGTSDEDGGAACSISRGNPNLKPRKAHNFDFSIDQYFDHSQGMVSLAFFDKMIQDDIYTLRNLTMQDGVLYNVSQPMNATGSNIHGLELSVLDRSVALWGQFFDLSMNATWMQGNMKYVNSSGQQTRINHMIYQPDVLVNGAVTWHIPAIQGGLRATATYTDKYLTSIGSYASNNQGQGAYFMLNMAFWHKVYKNVSFRYEVQNLTGTRFSNVVGNKLQYTNNTSYLGRGIYFHVVLNSL
ncbi:MAG: TonB-dependent receptor [Acetobacter orientalis]|uniref:TonB-dependent receptor n=1 Tax=Acetobacter orientalis TaxID=146474 RepID=UPI0039EB02BA